MAAVCAVLWSADLVLFFRPEKEALSLAVRKRKLTWFWDKLTESESEKGRTKTKIPDSVCEKIFGKKIQKERSCR